MDSSSKPHRPALASFAILITAALLTLTIGQRTNYLGPKWDTEYYVDMATHGLAGNNHLAAPFAYRPAIPLFVHALAQTLHTDPERTFRVCAWLMCFGFVVANFYFALWFGASFPAAWLASVLPALYFLTVKWTLFSGAMVDIYAYPLLLFAFTAMWRGRFYLCLTICAAGLFFKEFLLLPLLTQCVVLTLQSRRRRQGIPLKPILWTALVLFLCFVLPRLLIHVAATFQDIDPLNNPRSLKLLIAYPASLKRNYNILFYYLAFWLPVLLLLNKRRWVLLQSRLAPYRLLLTIYLALHFLLVMYGGTNLDVFVTYTLPIELIALTILLDAGKIAPWEKLLTVAAVILFNRLWMFIPLPDKNLNAYLNFYGGYHTEVTWWSFARMAELLSWLLLFFIARKTTQSSQL